MKKRNITSKEIGHAYKCEFCSIPFAQKIPMKTHMAAVYEEKKHFNSKYYHSTSQLEVFWPQTLTKAVQGMAF